MKRLAIMVLMSLVTLSSYGGVNKWTHSLHGWASAVAIDPINSSIAYATTHEGIFKTSDRGVQWTLVEPFPEGIAIAINPLDTNNVIAGSADPYNLSASLRVSFDAGLTWRKVHPFKHQEFGVHALVFDRSSPQTVYAALDFHGIGKSVDGGLTWTFSKPGDGLRCCFPDFYRTMDVAISAAASPVLYTASKHLSISSDGANSWQHFGGLLAEPFEAWTVSIDPGNAARIYVTGYFQPSGGAASFTSGDGGTTWQRLPTNAFGRIAIDPRVPTTLYATQKTRGWHGNPPPARGVLRSTDGGQTWAEFNEGLTNMDVSSVVVDASGTLLYATTTVGVFVQEIDVSPRRRGVRR